MSKIGAFESVLIATIVSDPFMPATCWTAPEIPTAMYTSGVTTFARLPDLSVLREPAVVDDRPRRGERRAERVGELLDELEVLLLLDAAPDGDEHVGVRDVDIATADLLEAGDARA